MGLAGPANRQGRIAGSNAMGLDLRYAGVLGTRQVTVNGCVRTYIAHLPPFQHIRPNMLCTHTTIARHFIVSSPPPPQTHHPSVCQIFGATVASTGLSEKAARDAGFHVGVAEIVKEHHAGKRGGPGCVWPEIVNGTRAAG